MSPVALLRLLWGGKLRIFAITFAFIVLGSVYLVIAKPWYRAEVVLVPQSNGKADGLSGGLLQFAGQFGLANLALGMSNQSEPMAVLKSRDFSSQFIRERDLVPVLVPYDEAPIWKRWLGIPDDAPDIRDAVDYFTNEVLDVSQDPKTELVTISVTWTDSQVAAEWANDLAVRINRQMRDRALSESQRNVEYLKNQLTSTNLVEIQVSIGRLLDAELRRLMIARGNKDFSYRIVDSAEVPKRPHHPRALFLIAACTLMGFVVGSLVVLSRKLVPEPGRL